MINLNLTGGKRKELHFFACCRVDRGFAMLLIIVASLGFWCCVSCILSCMLSGCETDEFGIAVGELADLIVAVPCFATGA